MYSNHILVWTTGANRMVHDLMQLRRFTNFVTNISFTIITLKGVVTNLLGLHALDNISRIMDDSPNTLQPNTIDELIICVQCEQCK